MPKDVVMTCMVILDLMYFKKLINFVHECVTFVVIKMYSTYSQLHLRSFYTLSLGLCNKSDFTISARLCYIARAFV